MSEKDRPWCEEKKDIELIKKIADRAVTLGMSHMTVLLDLYACITKTPLDLQMLLDFEDGDFLHDIYGINKNINHFTYELDNCFLPRCAK